MRISVRVALIAAVLCLAGSLTAQVRVELDEVSDNRVNAGDWQGMLELRVKLTGDAVLDKATAARIVVKEARDDRGTNLLGESARPNDFMSREYNLGTLQFALSSPPRAASSVKIKGTVELFVPARDPNAVVRIDKALAKLDAPLNAKALKAAKVTLTPLSRDGYAKVQQARKLDETKIAAIRAEGKKRGVSEKEIDEAIEMAKAFEGMESGYPENAVVLSGTKADFDRVFRVNVLDDEGKPIEMPSRSVSSRGDDSVMTLQSSTAPPPDAAIQIYLLTDKARVSTPFELTVELP